MSDETDMARVFFFGRAEEYALYRQVMGVLRARYSDMAVRVQKTQITLRVNGRMLCALWMPIRKIRGRPEHYLVLTFSLRRRAQDARIIQSVEPYPGRFTHHTLLCAAPDEQVLTWLDEAIENTQRRK